MKDLKDLRQELDAIDREMVALFQKRMEVSKGVAEYKIANGLPVLDSSREKQVLASRVAMLDDGSLAESVRALYVEIMRLSRGIQEKCVLEAKGQ